MTGFVGELESSLPSIYVVAHELKAPLILVRQLAYQLKEASVSNEVETIDRMIFSLDRSLRLVESISKTSRLEDGLFGNEPIQARSICLEVADEIQPLAKQYNQSLVVKLSNNRDVVVGHRSLLAALLLNLCDNALIHNSTGEAVLISTFSKKESVVFSVRDNGPKVNYGTFEQLRQMLGKGPLPPSGRPRSSGLGLWIASKFASSMGGEMTITRHRNSGVSVSFMLPRSNQLSLPWE